MSRGWIMLDAFTFARDSQPTLHVEEAAPAKAGPHTVDTAATAASRPGGTTDPVPDAAKATAVAKAKAKEA